MDDATIEILLEERKTIVRRLEETHDVISRDRQSLRALDEVLHLQGVPTTVPQNGDVESPPPARGRERWERIEIALQEAGHPMGTRDVWNLRDDHFGYRTVEGVRKALEGMERLGWVTRTSVGWEIPALKDAAFARELM